MKMYLSSFRVGGQKEKLIELYKGRNTAIIANATDPITDLEERKSKSQREIDEFRELGLQSEDFDLRNYFGKPDQLSKDFAKYDAVWIRGGNVLTLRQAFKLSGFDKLLLEKDNDPNFVYGGYSAGICILSPSLKGLELVDEPDLKVYKEDIDTIWEGLSIVDYSFCPHYKSDHPESEAINKVVDFYIDNKILFKALRDGDVIITE